MKKMISTAIILFGSFSFAAFAGGKKLALEPLKPDDVKMGCSCGVRSATKATYVSTDIEANAPAIVSINGKKTQLKFMNVTGESEKPKLGDKVTKVYGEGDMRLILNHTTTFVCPENSDSCEVTRYSTDIKVRKGKERFELKDLEGDCGC